MIDTENSKPKYLCDMLPDTEFSFKKTVNLNFLYRGLRLDLIDTAYIARYGKDTLVTHGGEEVTSFNPKLFYFNRYQKDPGQLAWLQDIGPLERLEMHVQSKPREVDWIFPFNEQIYKDLKKLIEKNPELQEIIEETEYEFFPYGMIIAFKMKP